MINPLIWLHPVKFLDWHAAISPEQVPLAPVIFTFKGRLGHEIVPVPIVCRVSRSIQPHLEDRLAHVAHNAVLSLRHI